MVEESVKKIYSKTKHFLGIRPCEKSSKFPLKLLRNYYYNFKEIDFPFTTLSTLKNRTKFLKIKIFTLFLNQDE